MFKVTKGITQDIFANIFNTRNKMNYNLSNFLDFTITVRKVFKYGVFSGPYFLVFGLNTGKYGP